MPRRPAGVLDRVRILQKAFNKTMEDPEFLAEAKRVRLSIYPIKGDVVARMFKRLFREATPEAIAALKKLL